MRPLKYQITLSTTNLDDLRRLTEELGIVHDESSFNEFLQFLNQLVTKHRSAA